MKSTMLFGEFDKLYYYCSLI